MRSVSISSRYSSQVQARMAIGCPKSAPGPGSDEHLVALGAVPVAGEVLEHRDLVRRHLVGLVPDHDPAVLEVVDGRFLGNGAGVDAPVESGVRPVRAGRGRGGGVRPALRPLLDVRPPVHGQLGADAGRRSRREEREQGDGRQAHDDQGADPDRGHAPCRSAGRDDEPARRWRASSLARVRRWGAAVRRRDIRPDRIAEVRPMVREVLWDRVARIERAVATNTADPKPDPPGVRGLIGQLIEQLIDLGRLYCDRRPAGGRGGPEPPEGRPRPLRGDRHVPGDRRRGPGPAPRVRRSVRRSGSRCGSPR